MGLPNILINFKAQATTAIQRGKTGIVCLLLKETTDKQVRILEDVTEIPTTLTKDNQDTIKLAFLGGVNAVAKVIVVTSDTITNGLKVVETQKFNYLALGSNAIASEVTEVATFIKGLRDTKNIKVKAVLPSSKSDHEGIINFTTTDIVVGDKTYTNTAYCSRIASLLAGTPLNISSAYFVLPEVDDVPKFTKSELDAKVDAGEFIIFHDGEKVKVARGVNSLTTTTADKSEDYKSIKIIDIMDLIYTDIKRVAEDSYIGKYPNNYDNKCNLMVAITAYLESLAFDSLLEKDSIKTEIDMLAQTIYLKSIGVDVASMSEQEIKRANTKTKVFIKSKFKIVNAIEDITLNCLV